MEQCDVALTTTQNRSTPRRIWLGREQEVAELEAGLAELRAGRGSLFLITGEPGIGKTRLSDEVGRSASAQGIAVHWGRAWEAGGAPSYWPLTQVLRSICRGLADAALLGAVGSRGAELVELLPELGQRIAGLARVGELATRDRFQLFDAVNTFLHAAAVTPHVIVLDDLHAADLPSLLLLQFLVRDSSSRPLLVIGTYREAEARLAPETAQALTQLSREATVLPLRRLDRAQVAAYLARATGMPPSAERLELMHRQTEGNPLFLRELLSLQTAAFRPPESIRELLRARLSLLTPQVRSLLELAAVLGREFEPALLAEAAGASQQELWALLGPAEAAAIIEPLEHARWRFTHVLLREALYADLASEQRAALHRAAAAMLARRRELPLFELAHHLLNAIPTVAVAQAVEAALRAAERALEVLAFEDAAGLLARAAQLLDSGATDAGEQRRAFEVWLALGIARIRSSDVENGQSTCRRALELARRLGDGELLARAVLGFAYEFTPGVRNLELIALLQEALAALPSRDGTWRARCMAQLAAERQPEPDTRQPIGLARGAVAMARRLGDRDTLRFTLTAASLALMVYGDLEERIAVGQETLRLALAARDLRVALRAHLLLFNDYWENGDVQTAEAHIGAYESLAAQFSHGAFHWALVGIRGALALGQGRFDEAEQAFRETERLSHKDATRGTSMAALPAGFCCATERYAELADLELRVRAAFGGVAHDLGARIGEMLIARLYARAGDERRTAAQLAALRAQPLFAEIVEPAWLALLTEPCQLLGDLGLAARLYAALAPRARRFFHLGHLGPWCEPPYARQLGLLAQTLGRLDEAVAQLAVAEAEAARVGMRAHLGRLRYELAGALLARDSSGDAEQAVALLETAHALARELGQASLLPLVVTRSGSARARRGSAARGADASGAAARRSSAPANPSTSELPAPLVLARQGDYWSVAQGSHLVQLRDSRGLRVLERLVAHPGQEFHVLQLVSAGDAPSARGDAGSVLDSEAVHSYRTRLLELREELEQAQGFADAGRSERAQREIELLTEELARAVGLGGRERRVGSASERARTTVQKRLREAIRRIESELPELGLRLERAVRTGTFCGYFPEGRPRARRP
ncbi:MAG: AAA family ATPase [Deltaproteobacteria bacterium]